MVRVKVIVRARSYFMVRVNEKVMVSVIMVIYSLGHSDRGQFDKAPNKLYNIQIVK
jgi:hypothetical protein